MKIAILTYFFANNYGAVLQATALQAALKKYIDEDVTFLQYCNTLQKRNNALIQHGSIKAWCYNIVRLPFIGRRKKRIERFEQYRKYYWNNDGKYLNDEDVFAEAEKYDLIVVGSDQVWNPNAPDFSKIYFTVFNVGRHVCTYGVSLGDCKADQLLPYIPYINKVPQILVRERSAIDRLEISGYKSPIYMVLDPVLLHTKEEWERMLELSENKCKEKYILCYFLRRQHVFSYWNIAKKMAKRLGYKLICINVNAGLFAYTHKTIMDAGPIEFLELIRGASLVLTNSFHGTAFSILFHIPFYSLYVSKGNDSRIEDILQILDLEDRQLSRNDFMKDNVFDIDFAKTDILLSRERQKAIEHINRWRE